MNELLQFRDIDEIFENNLQLHLNGRPAIWGRFHLINNKRGILLFVSVKLPYRDDVGQPICNPPGTGGLLLNKHSSDKEIGSYFHLKTSLL